MEEAKEVNRIRAFGTRQRDQTARIGTAFKGAYVGEFPLKHRNIAIVLWRVTNERVVQAAYCTGREKKKEVKAVQYIHSNLKTIEIVTG